MIKEELLKINNQKQELEKQIYNILYKESGKKIFVKYDNKKYYIPKKHKAKFIYLMSSLKKLDKNSKILVLKEETKKITDSEEIKNIIDKMTLQEIGSALNSMPSTDEQTALLIAAGILCESKTKETRPETQKELEEPKKEDSNYEIKLINIDKTTYKVKNINKKSFKTKLKYTLCRAGLIAAAVICLTTGIKISNHSLDKNIKQKTPTTTTEKLVETKNEFTPNYIKDKYYLEYINSSINNNIYTEENNLAIGSNITLKDDSNIYLNSKDSYLEKNAYKPYFDTKDTRVILGVSIEINNQLVKVLAHEPKANQKINNILSDGGTIVSVLVGNQTQNEYLQTKPTENLTIREITELSEGWININNIEKTKTTTLEKTTPKVKTLSLINIK